MKVLTFIRDVRSNFPPAYLKHVRRVLSESRLETAVDPTPWSSAIRQPPTAKQPKYTQQLTMSLLGGVTNVNLVILWHLRGEEEARRTKKPQLFHIFFCDGEFLTVVL